MARSGRTVEALAIFERIVAGNPADIEARLWIGRLQLLMGRTEEAEAGFRAVLLDHPSDVDARIGFGVALTRRDAWSEALEVLHDAERDAGNNADLFAALARAYRRAGDDRRALRLAVGAAVTLLAVLLSDATWRQYMQGRDVALLVVVAILESFGYRQLNSLWGCVGTVQALSGKGGWVR